MTDDRADWQRHLEHESVTCGLCGRRIAPGDRWELVVADVGPLRLTRPWHARCAHPDTDDARRRMRALNALPVSRAW